MEHPLATARQRADLTQQALATLVSCDRVSIVRIENWRQTPSLSLVSDIIDVLRGKGVELSADAFLRSAVDRADAPHSEAAS